MRPYLCKNSCFPAFLSDSPSWLPVRASPRAPTEMRPYLGLVYVVNGLLVIEYWCFPGAWLLVLGAFFVPLLPGVSQRRPTTRFLLSCFPQRSFPGFLASRFNSPSPRRLTETPYNQIPAFLLSSEIFSWFPGFQIILSADSLGPDCPAKKFQPPAWPLAKFLTSKVLHWLTKIIGVGSRKRRNNEGPCSFFIFRALGSVGLCCSL